ncbi:MAG: FixH family protein [Ktedonobacterales bacterium]|nr:FixH family protein [Ktedonobacterales bacterium]
MGALLVPPSGMATPQAISLGNYQVSYRTQPRQLIVYGTNDVALMVRDAAGNPLMDGTIIVHPRMVTMAMFAPDARAVVTSDAQYHAHIVFPMAGEWHLTIELRRPGLAALQAVIPVSVHWR